jgi:hypothetical protein
LIAEISRVYELNSSPISRKHLEIIVRQMFSRRKIQNPQGTRFTTGQVIENFEFVHENNRVAQEGELPATAQTMILVGISEISLTSKSWMSAAAFERTTKTLVNKAIEGGTDEFRGLMENVMIGNLIPAGTGLSEDFVPEVAELKRQRRPMASLSGIIIIQTFYQSVLWCLYMDSIKDLVREKSANRGCDWFIYHP